MSLWRIIFFSIIPQVLSNSAINSFFSWNHSGTIVLITRVEKRSQFPLELYMFCIIRSAKTSCTSFEECYIILFRVFCALRNWNFYVTTFITSSVTLPKREAAILKFGAPAISASREVIIPRYDAILDKSERTHLYNDWRRRCYSGSVTWILTRFQMMEVGVTLSINLPFRN